MPPTNGHCQFSDICGRPPGLVGHSPRPSPLTTEEVSKTAMKNQRPHRGQIFTTPSERASAPAHHPPPAHHGQMAYAEKPQHPIWQQALATQIRSGSHSVTSRRPRWLYKLGDWTSYQSIVDNTCKDNPGSINELFTSLTASPLVVGRNQGGGQSQTEGPPRPQTISRRTARKSGSLSSVP